MNTYIAIKDNLILKIVEGDENKLLKLYSDYELKKISSDNEYVCNTNINEYENGKLKPLSKRINEGYVEIPEGMKLENDKFIPMTQIEKIKANLEEIPEGMKLESDELIPMTESELVEAGILSVEDYNNRVKLKRQSEYKQKVDPIVAEIQRLQVLGETDNIDSKRKEVSILSKEIKQNYRYKEVE